MYIGDANIYHTNIVYDFCSPSPIFYSLGTARIICTAAKEQGKKEGTERKTLDINNEYQVFYLLCTSEAPAFKLALLFCYWQ